jgi:hypothetical protein
MTFDYNNIKRVTEKAVLSITCLVSDKWCACATVDGDNEIYYPKMGSVSIPAENTLSFYDLAEQREVEIHTSTHEIWKVEGAFSDKHLNDTDLLRRANDQATNLAKRCSKFMSGISIKDNKCLFQYAKRGIDVYKIQQFEIFSDHLSFDSVVSQEVTDAELPGTRACWMNQINIYVSEALGSLQGEKEEVSNEEYTTSDILTLEEFKKEKVEELQEIDTVIDMVKNIPAEAEEELGNLNTYKDIVGYWHPLILPAPSFAF